MSKSDFRLLLACLTRSNFSSKIIGKISNEKNKYSLQGHSFPTTPDITLPSTLKIGKFLSSETTRSDILQGQALFRGVKLLRRKKEKKKRRKKEKKEKKEKKKNSKKEKQ